MCSSRVYDILYETATRVHDYYTHHICICSALRNNLIAINLYANIKQRARGRKVRRNNITRTKKRCRPGGGRHICVCTISPTYSAGASATRRAYAVESGSRIHARAFANFACEKIERLVRFGYCNHTALFCLRETLREIRFDRTHPPRTTHSGSNPVVDPFKHSFGPIKRRAIHPQNLKVFGFLRGK